MTNIFSLAYWSPVMSSLENCLFRSSAHLFIGLFAFLLLNYMSCLSILESKALSVVPLANIFSQSVGCLFILFMVSFAVQELANLIRYKFLIKTFFNEWTKKS